MEVDVVKPWYQNQSFKSQAVGLEKVHVGSGLFSTVHRCTTSVFLDFNLVSFLCPDVAL